jgi:hypothetical protein
MEIALFCAYLLLLLALVLRVPFFRIPHVPEKLPAAVFLFKLLCGFVLVYVYTRHYPSRETADMYKFFDDSKVLHDALADNPLHFLKMLTGLYGEPGELQPYFEAMRWWDTPLYPDSYNESRILIRFNAFVRLFSFGWFSIHVLFMTFLSFTGCVALYRLFVKREPELVAGSFIAAFLLPSVLFWTSGVLKEGIVMSAMGLLLYLLLTPWRTLNPGRILLLLGATALLAATKAYVLLCLAPGLLAFYLSRNRAHRLYYFLGVNALLLLTALNLYRISPSLDVVHILCYKRGEYIYLAERTFTGSLITRNYLDFHWYSILAESPVALFNALFRPHLLELKSVMYLPPALENLFLLLVCALAIAFPRRPLQQGLFYLFLNYALLLLLLTGLTTPVLGSLVRYKTATLPLLFFAVFQLVNEKKIREFLRHRGQKSIGL